MTTTLRSHKGTADRLPVTRYAVLLFLLTAALTSAVALTLIRNAHRSQWQQNATALAGGARVSASSFGTLRSTLRVQASQLATSLELQRAVVTRNEAQLERIAATRHARIALPGHSVGLLVPQPRISTVATIRDGARVLATITVSLPLGKDVLALLREATTLPAHGSLMLLYNGRVVVGGPVGGRPQIADGRTMLGGVAFAAQKSPLALRGAAVVAVEPVSAIDALSERYRRLVFLAAAVTLALAGGLATRLARPIAQVVGEVAHLSKQVQTDALTGLANRRGLSDRLERELARALENGTSVSLVIADIDDFKLINDNYGHQTGDNIIRAAAAALAGSVRQLDLAARYGGEEFAVVLPGSRLADARRSAERMRQAVMSVESPSPAGELAHVTMSFGVAEFPMYATLDALVAAADAALYQAKRGGKNQVATAVVHAQLGEAGPGSAAETPVEIASVA
jgi:diguanylate cyclase (GGDEF)-like protein